MLPPEYERYEGLVICSIVIAGLLSLLFLSFILAYIFKWERLMTQIRIQRDNVARKELGDNNRKISHIRITERIQLSANVDGI